MSVNNIIAPNQHGFTSGRSCTTQLLITANYWIQSIEDGHSVDILYFDFAKAFDSVPHNWLIIKLQAYGISGRLLVWFKNFLTNRRQKVVLNHSSNWSRMVSGVPQGSGSKPLPNLRYHHKFYHKNIVVFAQTHMHKY